MELKLEDILPLLGAKATSEAVLAQAVADLNTYKKTSEREALVHAAETVKTLIKLHDDASDEEKPAETLIKLHDDASDEEKPAEKAAPKKRRTRKKASNTEVKEPEEKEEQPVLKAELVQGTPAPQQPVPAPDKPFAPKAPTDPNRSLFGSAAPAGQAQPQQKQQDNPFASQSNPFGA